MEKSGRRVYAPKGVTKGRGGGAPVQCSADHSFHATLHIGIQRMLLFKQLRVTATRLQKRIPDCLAVTY